jgi:GNAT acetyltransferase-like protein
MSVGSAEIWIAGNWVRVPALPIDDRTVIVTGKRLRLAEVQGEQWLEGEVRDPDAYVTRMREARLGADVFTFAQKLPNVEPRFSYLTEWDSIAAVRLNTFQEWWEGLPQVARKNTRRAATRGVAVRVQELDDTLVAGIAEINNETPIRQGRRFTHFGESLEDVKRDYVSYIDRSELTCAYMGDELIGFVKTIYCGKVAAIAKLQVKTAHYDNRPANALITKVIERCEQKGASFVTYGKMRYGNQSMTSLMEFKQRHGFQEIVVPRYYVPLSIKGAVALRLRLHRDLNGILPSSFVRFGTSLRDQWNKRGASQAGVA